MPLSSGITSVDTLQVLPGSEAFVSGQMLREEYIPSPEDIFLPESAGAVSSATAEPWRESWADSPYNTGAMLFAIFLMMLNMRKFINIFSYLSGGLVRWKLLAELEHNMQMARVRDSLMLPAYFVFCTVLSRFSAFVPDIAAPYSPEIKTLSVFALTAALLVFRWLLILIISTRRMGISRDIVLVSNGAGKDFFILATAMLSAVLLAGTLMPGRELVMGEVCKYVILSFWVVFILRKMQILFSDAGLLRAFLYLCSVEIPPAAMLVVSMMFL